MTLLPLGGPCLSIPDDFEVVDAAVPGRSRGLVFAVMEGLVASPIEPKTRFALAVLLTMKMAASRK